MHESPRHATAEQRVAGLPGGAGIEVLAELDLPASEDGDGHAIAIEDAVAGERGELGTGNESADQIERVGTGDRNPCAGTLSSPHLAQRPDCLRQRELLPGEAANEAPAADFAARFQPAINVQQLAPWWQPSGFALEQAPEHYAIAAQQRAGDVLDGAGVPVGPSAWGKRPSARALHAKSGGPPSAAAAGRRLAQARRHEQRAQAAEAVRGHHAEGHELGERVFDLRPQEAGTRDQVIEEGGAVLADELGHGLGIWR